ncbi:MAG: hypothetical protein ACI3XE_01140, partial [Eubacteriales bacterium]
MKANLQTPELQADAAGTPPADTPETEPAVTDITVSDEAPTAEEVETEGPATAEAVEDGTATPPELTPEEADAALKEKVESIPYSYHKKPLFDFVKRFFDILLSGVSAG